MIKGQPYRWYEPALQRQRERAALERQATAMLRSDRVRLRKSAPKPSKSASSSVFDLLPRRVEGNA